MRCFLAAQAIGHIVRHLDPEWLAPFANIDFVLLFLHLIQKHIHPSHAALLPGEDDDKTTELREKQKEEEEEIDVDMLSSPSSSPSKTDFLSHQRKGEKDQPSLPQAEREEEEREREMRMRVLSLGLEGQKKGRQEEEEDERETRERHDLIEVSLGILTETLMKCPQAFELNYRIEKQVKRGAEEEDMGVHRNRFFLTILDILDEFIRSLLVYNPYQNDCYFSGGGGDTNSCSDRSTTTRGGWTNHGVIICSLRGGGGRRREEKKTERVLNLKKMVATGWKTTMARKDKLCMLMKEKKMTMKTTLGEYGGEL